MELQNNTIYQYQGGGYDGCFWEWNFFFIDKDGNFHDIFSSGRNGITDIESAKCVDDTGNIYTYCIDSEKDLDELANETHGHLLSGLMQWFEENQNGEVYAICIECKEKFSDLDDIIVDRDIHCYECESASGCSCCGAYVGVDDTYCYIDLDDICNLPECLFVFDDGILQELADEMENGDDDYCESCLQNAAQEIENNGTKEALFLALLTGKGLFTIVRII